MELSLKRRVQFYETDAAGIVHFSTYFRYMEEAEHELWRSVGLSVAPPDAEIGWPRVNATFDYQRPLRFEDQFEVRVRIDALSKRTIRYACDITKDGDAIGSGSLTVVCVRKQPDGGMKSVEIPTEIVARLKPAATEA
jgi:YbgC/YbaW family acyl-CoA thioester hydrolase